MESIDTQIGRLKRHFDSCCSGYDQISLLDLAHSLRIIGESRGELKSLTQNNRPLWLKNCVQTKKVKKLVKNTPFVMALFPRLIKTEKMSFGTFILLHRAMTDKEAKDISAILKTNPTKNCDIDTWFRTEAVAWRNGENGMRKSLSKERIVKRVANYLGGSHPELEGKERASDDDKILKHFMTYYEVAERPLPYLILMSIAQELLIALGEVS